jgi:hypothetical protein
MHQPKITELFATLFQFSQAGGKFKYICTGLSFRNVAYIEMTWHGL